MRDFQKLIIWQKGHQLTLKIYNITSSFPKEELYGLISQMRRSSSSIPTNIAEGCGHNSNAEMKRFLAISSASASELEYQIILSKDLGYISENRFQELLTFITDLKKMLHSFIKNIK